MWRKLVEGFEELAAAIMGDLLQHLLVVFVLPDNGGRSETAAPIP